MQTKSTAKTIILSRGGWATWRCTKFNDREFTAVNQRGVTHHFDNERDAVSFVNFLESKGFVERKRGASLNTIKRVATA